MNGERPNAEYTKKTLLIIVCLLLFVLSACTDSDPELMKKDVITIFADYSSYCEDAKNIVSANELVAYSDVACQNELIITVKEIKKGVVIYQIESPSTVQDIYLLPPIATVRKKIEKQQIEIRDGMAVSSDYFSVENISVQKSISLDRELSLVEIVFELSSQTGQYPANMMLVHNGYHYSGAFSATFSTTSSNPHSVIPPRDVSCHYQIADSEQAAQDLLNDAYLSYNTLLQYVYTSDAVFTSDDDIRIHVIEAN